MKFTLPQIAFSTGGLAAAGSGTVGAKLIVIGGGTVTGSQILTVGGVLGGTAMFLSRENFEKMAAGNNQHHSHQVERLLKEVGEFTKKNARTVHEELHHYLEGERTIERIRQIIQDLIIGRA